MSTLSRKDKLIPWYFVMFFTVIIAVNAVMITLAIGTSTGTVTDHPYEKGIAYNRVIQAEEAQEKLGWKADIELNGNKLHVALYDADRKAIPVERMTARFIRPTQDGMDFEVPLTQGDAEVSFPAKGLWEIRVFAQANGHTYQQAQRITVP